MEKLKERWGIESNIQIVLIFIVFAINGSFAAYIAKPLTEFVGLTSETPSYIYMPIRIILVFVVYQTTLPIIGFCFGQFNFFWNMEKKILKRVGFKRFFKDEV